MAGEHLEAPIIRRFMAGRASPKEARRVVRHLLTGCGRCRRIAARASSFADADRSIAEPGALDRAMRRVADKLESRAALLRQERDQVPELAAELQRHPPARRLILALNSRRYHNWFLCRHIVDEAFEAGFEEPVKALELAELGVAIAGELGVDRYGRRLANDLRARSWATLGNARRICSDLAGAEQALEKATELIEEGTGDPLEAASVSYKLGTLRLDQRRFDEAFRHLDRACVNYRRAGDGHLVGRVLAEKARALGEEGKPQEAIQMLEEALRLLDVERDPRMVVVAKQNLSVFLQQSGHFGQALGVLTEILPAYLEQKDTMNLLRLRWLEGKLALAQGRNRWAEKAFLEVRSAFLERKIGYDAALVSLDLATVYVKEGRVEELRAVAAEMLSAFRSLNIHREALASYRLLVEAAEKNEVTLRLVRDLSLYFERARRGEA